MLRHKTMKLKEPQDRPQTIKQAKAAFKARGPTAVSAAERRRLERGAQLLERATKIKEQEQRKKDQLRKKEIQETKEQTPQKPAVLLGTQRRLDKFGYKSSQFHLGAFLKPSRPLVLSKENTDVPAEPWDDGDEVVDDDVLLDIVTEVPSQQRDTGRANEDRAATIEPLQEDQEDSSPSTEEDFGEWDDFIQSSTQLARELSSDRPTVKNTSAPPTLHFSSFGSADFDFSVEDFEDLEKQAVSEQAGDRKNKSPSATIACDDDMDRKRMPPPNLPLPPRPRRLRSATSEPAVGISLAELESLVNEEIELTQLPGG